MPIYWWPSSFIPNFSPANYDDFKNITYLFHLQKQQQSFRPPGNK